MRVPQTTTTSYRRIYLFVGLAAMAMAVRVTAQHQFFYKEVFDKSSGFTATPTCMAEDADGFLWVGTSKGLFRFDGSLAREIKLNCSDSLSDKSRWINDLAIDNQQHILWLATKAGVIRYAWKTGETRLLSAQEYFPLKDYTFSACTRIFRDRQGAIWANFAVPGLVQILSDGKEMARYTWPLAKVPEGLEQPSIVHGLYIYCFAQDALQDSIIWIGTRGGLVKFNKQTQKARHYFYHQAGNGFISKSNPIHAIYAYHDGMVYLGSYNGGLLIFNPETEQFTRHLPHPEVPLEKERKNNVDDIFPYSSTKLWIGRGGEVLIFDIAQQKFTRATNAANIKFIDKSGNFWSIGAGGLALFHHSKNQIRRIPFPDEPQYKTDKPFRPWEDTVNHQIYVRSNNVQGLTAYDRQQQRWRLYPLPKTVKNGVGGNVLEKIDAGILIDNQFQFYLMPKGAKAFQKLDLSVPDYGWMYSQKAADGSVFITATKGYLLWLKPHASSFVTFSGENLKEPFPEFFRAPTIRYIDPRGRAWISCYGGFSIFDPKTSQFKHISIRENREQHFEQYRQFSLDQEGRMWCLGQNNIGWLDPDCPEEGLQQRFGLENGYQLHELGGDLSPDANGMYWFKSNEDLARFDPATLKLSLFEGLGAESCYVMESGELMFLNARGIGLMHPDSMHPNTEKPRPYIAWFKIFEKEQALTGNLLSPPEIRLQPDENFFSIGFSALGYYNGQQYRFAYKLEGFDRDWVYPESGIRFAGYTGIKGGDYIFRLKVATSRGIWNETELQWHIHVGTPWWATWWFRLAVLAVVLAALYFWMKSRFRHQQTLLENQRLQLEREQTLRQERDRIAAEMHDELGAGLSTIRLLSLVAKSQETDAQQLKRIEKIAQNAADVMGKMAEIVWVMNSRNDSLESFAAYVCRYAGEYLDTHNIFLLFEMPEGKYTLNSTQRRTILLAIKECLHNIVKHAGATEVKLYFVAGKRLKIIVADNGSGIPKEVLQQFQQHDPHLSGNGLYNLHQRMEKLGGKTTIENHQGTKITLDTGISLSD